METCLFANRNCPATAGSAESVCFLAAPCAQEVQTRVDAIVAAAEDIGLRCLVAERNQEFNRDVFCEKICRPIIESRFCIVLLDKSRQRGSEDPFHNPNVLYEYGLMSALRKTVVAFVPQEQEIPFNVRHLDLVPYGSKELRDRAKGNLGKAIEKTQGQYKGRANRKRTRALRSTPPLVRSARRVLELRGFRPSIPGVVGASACDDTSFEPHFADNGLVFLSHVGEGGVSVEDARKDAVLVGDRLRKAWGKARAAAEVAKSKRWGATAAQARKDMQRLQGSRMIITCSSTSSEIAATRASGKDSVEAGFGAITLEIWDEAETKKRESEVGLG